MRTLKKTICILLTAALLLSVAALPASAIRPLKLCEPYGIRRLLHFPEDGVYFPDNDYQTVNRFYSNPSNTFKFFSQLTIPQKRIYNALLNSRMGLDSPDFIYDGEVWGREVDIPFSDYTLASTSSETLLKLIDTMVVAAISSLMEDYPEFFWVGGYGYGMLPGYDISTGQYSIKTLVIILMPNPYSYEVTEWDKIEEDYNYLCECIDSIEIEGSNRYEKLKSIHDSICQKADYDFTYVLPHAYDPLGIFVDPYDFVCEGYSETFKLLCDREGIPCICVVGQGGYGDNTGAHKWNYVQMEDGQWYGVDVTWDDQDEIMYDYFLVGSDTKSEFFGHYKFIEEHVPSGALFMGISYSLKYPTLSKTRYYYPGNKLTSSDGLWHYKLLDDGTASITSGDCDVAAYRGTQSNVSVPTEIDGYTVSEVGVSAFAHCDGIESITVPDGITKIGRFAFEDCSAASVSLPASITEIPYGAFLSSSIKSVEFSDSVTKIGRQAFEDCLQLESLKMTDSITEIGNYAFNGCYSLNSITLSDSLERISECAFRNCRSMEEITFPDSIKEIGISAFEGCNQLRQIDLSAVDTIGKQAFLGCSNLESVTLSDSLAQLDTKTFAECSELSEINIPDSLTKIGDAVFYKCYKLEKLLIPASVTEISKSVFIKAGIKEIYGYNDSYAHQYADSYSIHFIAIDGVDCEAGVHLYRTHRSADETVYECMLCGNAYSQTVPVLSCDHALSFKADIDYKDNNKTYYALFNADEDGIYRFSVDADKAQTIAVYDSNVEVSVLSDRDGYEFAEGRQYTIAVNLSDQDTDSFELTAAYLGKNISINFPDVKENDWYYEAAYYNAARGWITGFKDGTFGPVRPLTRQDFVVILARIAKADLSKYDSCKLKDIDMNTYYGPSVAWAVNEGIITGYSNGYFGVGHPITREQVCTILYRYKGEPQMTNSDRALLNSFNDKSRISSYAVNAMAWAVKNGVVSGKNPTTLAPTATASRAEIATIVMRMDKAGLL